MTRLSRQFRETLPGGLGAFAVASVALPEAPDGYVTPDLAVLPTAWMESDDWLTAPEDTALAVQVVPRSREIRDKADWYAVAGVAVLLVIDPRKGTWALHTRPDGGAYQDVLPGKYGESVPLPEPLGFEVGTDGFPVYGAAPRARQRQGRGADAGQ